MNLRTQYHQSSRNLLSSAGQLTDSIKNFVGQKSKMTDKNYRVLLYSNTSFSKFSKHCNFDGKLSKYRGNMCNFHPLETKSPKILYGRFLDYYFLLDILSGKLTKFAGHFRNLPVLFNRPTVFAKTVS